MVVINIDCTHHKYYEKFRRDIGRFLFSRRQREKYSLSQAAALAKIKPEHLDQIELGRRNLRVLAIMRLLSLYRSHVVIDFGGQKQEVPLMDAPAVDFPTVEIE